MNEQRPYVPGTSAITCASTLSSITSSSSSSSSVPTASSTSTRNSRPITAAVVSTVLARSDSVASRRPITSRMPSGSSSGQPLLSGVKVALPRWRIISSRKNGLPRVSSHSARLTCAGMPWGPNPPISALESDSSSPDSSIRSKKCSRRSCTSMSTSGAGRSVSRIVATISSGDSPAARTSWRSISSVGLSAQCRSSRTSSTGRLRAMSFRTSETASNSR